jgi:hypothetical protein
MDEKMDDSGNETDAEPRLEGLASFESETNGARDVADQWTSAELFAELDEPIRVAFGAVTFDGNSYGRFLRLAAESISGAARRFGVDVDQLPDLLGRPTSSPAKLVDEYLWTRITRNL